MMDVAILVLLLAFMAAASLILIVFADIYPSHQVSLGKSKEKYVAKIKVKKVKDDFKDEAEIKYKGLDLEEGVDSFLKERSRMV